eukprot:5852902-Pleurochrysis_carterae.AAC.7
MRSPEAWTRKRMEERHATHRSRTTGATGARKSEAATTGRHAALHARDRSNGESDQDGQESAVGTPVSPTASEKLSSRLTPAPSPAPYAAPLPFADWLLRRRQTWHRLIRLGQKRGRREERGVGTARTISPRSPGAAPLRQHLREPTAGAARCAPRRQAEV